MIDNRTPNLNLALPHQDNTLLEDVARLRSALTALDSVVTTPADVTAAINAVLDGTPAALDTLNELAAALGDDANFAATMTTALAGKAATSHAHALSDVTGLVAALATKLESLPTASAGTLGGIKIGDGLVIDGAGVVSVPSAGGGTQTFTLLDITPTAGQTTFAIAGGYVVGQIEVLLNGTELMADDYTATNGSNIVLAVGAGVTDTLRVRKWAQFVTANHVAKAGDTMTGALTLSGAPTNSLHAATKAYVDGSSGVPGTVIYFAANAAPTGYLKANGATLSRTTYATLFAAIGTTFGAGDGSTNFVIPDLRGYFARGWDDGRGIDSGRAFGSTQVDANLSHTHTGTTDTTGAHTHGQGATSGNTAGLSGSPASGVPYASSTSEAGSHSHTFTTAANGGTESRPKNIALLACIKF